ncbi:MAG: hypothetical protein ACPH98_04020 [Candidatus Puniceispirillales bacterium]
MPAEGAQRRRQNEQSQRLADVKSISAGTDIFTTPQWHVPKSRLSLFIITILPFILWEGNIAISLDDGDFSRK